MTIEEPVPDVDASVLSFWEVAKRQARIANLPGYFGPGELESLAPPAWSFSGEEADAAEVLDELLVEGALTTSTALVDYEAADEAPPEIGTLGIVLDARGVPRALVVTSSVVIDDGDVTETITVLHAAD